MSQNKDYVVVTTISQFRIRYVMHKDDLQELNPDMPVDPIEWACDAVVAEQPGEFSQRFFGETVVDATTVTEDEMLEMFDKDNPYTRRWLRDYKIDWVRERLQEKVYARELRQQAER